MRADRAGAVVEGTTQREIHPRAHILGFPVLLAIGGHSGQRAEKGAIGVRRTGMNMALVEMRMHIDETRQHDLAAAIHAFALPASATGSATMRAIFPSATRIAARMNASPAKAAGKPSPFTSARGRLTCRNQ